jgi:amidase
MNFTDLCFLTATELQRLLRDREVSVRELIEAHLTQIDRVNPRLNAIITLLADQALEQASAADKVLLRGHQLGPLHGLPVAHKDMAETKGIRTTFGSPIFRDYVPDQDALIVERLKAAGAITIGKTNTPEFGAGSQTYNEVFGETLNPYDLAKTCGGSSGGAAVALACGMVPIADGGDLGGSLRNPASFCNVVGFRPSPGRVPSWPTEAAWFPLQVQGPMARTVEDVALILSAIAGPDSRSPIAITEPADIFTQPLERDFCGVQLAWSRDFGQLPVDPLVTGVLEAGRPTFESLGCEIIDETPDFSDADEIFKTWRAWRMELNFRDLLETRREAIKETIIWNVQEGKKLTGPQLARVELKRTQLYHRVRQFMERYEFMIFPVSQVPPFSVQDRYVTEINGEKMHTYIDWMKSCYFVSVTGLPAISVPCGFTPDGRPVGIQIVGRHHDDFGVLQLAFAFQQATEFWKERPSITR